MHSSTKAQLKDSHLICKRIDKLITFHYDSTSRRAPGSRFFMRPPRWQIRVDDKLHQPSHTQRNALANGLIEPKPSSGKVSVCAAIRQTQSAQHKPNGDNVR